MITMTGSKRRGDKDEGNGKKREMIKIEGLKIKKIIHRQRYTWWKEEEKIKNKVKEKWAR